MRYAIVAIILALVAWTPILADGPGKPPPIPEPVKCLQCEGNQCHAVYDGGSHSCAVVNGECVEELPCD
jgi:hypothetical protein